jgi:hypothetical protein
MKRENIHIRIENIQIRIENIHIRIYNRIEYSTNRASNKLD